MTRWISQIVIVSSIFKRENFVRNVMILLIYLTRMLTHGHFILSFLETGFNFTVTSLDKFIRDIEEPIIDNYGDFIYKRGTSKHPLHEALFENDYYGQCSDYRQSVVPTR